MNKDELRAKLAASAAERKTLPAPHGPTCACKGSGKIPKGQFASGYEPCLVGEIEKPTKTERMLKHALVDLFDLESCISEDIDLIEIGQHPATGEWLAWHVEYPEEGSLRLASGDESEDKTKPLPVGKCPKCQAPWYATVGFCGGCR